MKSQANIKVTLALPTFWQSEEYLFAEILKLPAEDRYSIKKENGPSSEKMLFNLLTCAKEDNPPYAAISAFGNDIPAMQGWWLQIDPVELIVDAGNICLVGREHLGLEEHETQRLVESLNQLLREDGLAIIYRQPAEWYLPLSSSPEVVTSPLSKVMGKDIRAYLPSGPQQGWWHKLITEMQMLLFDHPVNIKRQREGKPLVNSLWPWGEGAITSSYDLTKYARIWNNCSFVQGMIKLDASLSPLYSLSDFSNDQLSESGDYLIVCDYYQQDAILLDKLAQLFKRFHNGEIHQITVYLGNGDSYEWQARRKNFFSRLFG